MARASLLLFLDADDNLLVPHALDTMIHVWNSEGAAIYTDYVSKAVISEEEANRLKNSKRLLDYNPKNGLAMHLSYAADYDCERAIKQPANPLYLWNLITTLIPKVWHNEIGGFDEKMPSWEDWEYWLRMARSGKCFVRIEEPMVAYRFYTGNRRETGIQMPHDLLTYITKKLEGVEIMPCRSCGGNKKSVTVNVPVNNPVPNQKMVDSEMILISYENPNRGQHKVVGATTRINYGYRQGGGVEKFYVHKDDIAAYPDWFIPFAAPAVVVEQQAPVSPPPPPVEVPAPDFIETKPADADVGIGDTTFKPLDLQSIPGVTERIADSLRAKGVKTWEDIATLTTEELITVDGIGLKRAEAIINYAKKQL